MADFNWPDHDNAVALLRDMGCAVVVISPGDAETVFEDELTPEEARAWLRENHDEIEGAILSDQWQEQIHDVYEWKSRND